MPGSHKQDDRRQDTRTHLARAWLVAVFVPHWRVHDTHASKASLCSIWARWADRCVSLGTFIYSCTSYGLRLAARYGLELATARLSHAGSADRKDWGSFRKFRGEPNRIVLCVAICARSDEREACNEVSAQHHATWLTRIAQFLVVEKSARIASLPSTTILQLSKLFGDQAFSPVFV